MVVKRYQAVMAGISPSSFAALAPLMTPCINSKPPIHTACTHGWYLACRWLIEHCGVDPLAPLEVSTRVCMTRF